MPYVTLEQRNIHYEVYGKGKPMVFVHGWGGSVTSLRKLAKMCSKHRKCYLIDLPGFGKSEHPDPSWGVEEYAAIVFEFIQALSIKKPFYFGHSFGGSLGIFLAAYNPDLFPKLILCGTSYKRTGKQSPTAVQLNYIVTTYLPFFAGLADIIKPLLYRIFFPQSDYAKYPKLIPNFRKVITHDLSHLPEKISIPTLILWGERDTYTPVEFAHDLDKKITDSKLIIFPFKRHNLPIRYPETIYPEMKSFLNWR